MRKLTNSIGALWLRFIRLLSGGRRMTNAEVESILHEAYLHKQIDDAFPTTIEQVKKSEQEFADAGYPELPDSLKDPQAVLDRIKQREAR